MGEAARRRKNLIISDQKCIYCLDKGETEEHFPPRAMFLNRHRPDQMVFASCKKCNEQSRISDLAASFVARCERDAEDGSQIFEEWKKLGKGLANNEPDFLQNLFNKSNDVWAKGPNGMLRRYTLCEADGPIFKRHMRIFSLKCGMALFRYHINEPLPLNGAVYGTHFLNEGVPQSSVEKILGIMPLTGTLKQGRFSVEKQFAYRYDFNESEKIIAAILSFHTGLQIVTFAMGAEKEVRFGPDSGFVRSTPGHIFDEVPE